MSDSTEKAIQLFFDAAKTMIPVITGFLVFFAGTLKWLVPKSGPHMRPVALLSGLAILPGVASLGLWSGAMAFCIIATSEQHEALFVNAQTTARWGHVIFFLAIVLAMISYFFAWLRTPPRTQ
jgi:hypothetical protein